MHIDPFSIIIFTVIISLLMSAGLFVMSRDYLTDVKGIRHWAMALLLLAIGWGLFALYGIVPNFFSMVLGTIVCIIGLVFYFHALVTFKELSVPVRWIYFLVAITFIGHIYFIHINFNISAKIILTSICTAILLFASSFLSFSKQQGVCPVSHRLTGAIFAAGASVYTIRAIYYLVWNTQVQQTLFQHNIIQDITYLTNPILIVGTAFGFTLMFNEKYLDEKNQAQLALKKSVSLLNATLESTEDAILVVALTGNVVQYNSLFVKMWGIPAPILDIRSNQLMLEFVLNQLVDPEGFLNAVIDIDSHLYDENFSEVHFKDGRIIERYSRPQYLNNEPIGRVWSFRDVSERKRIERQLCESEERFRDLFENAPLPYQSLDIEGNFLYVNQAWLDMAGCSRHEVIGLFFGDFMTESSKVLVSQTFSQFKKEGYVSSPVFEFLRSDNGEKRLVTVNGRIARDELGVFQRTHCILRDITEQYRVEQELIESEQRFRQLIEKMPLALGLAKDNELIYINDRFKCIFGYTLDEIPTLEHWLLLAYPDESYRQWVLQTWIAAVERATYLGIDIEPTEYSVTCKDGTVRVVLISGIDLMDYRIITFVDVTERKVAEEEIKQLAFYDPLTGIPNRRKLLDRLRYAIALNHRAKTQFAVFMMDLDKFKAVNDSLGHAAGDELLKQVAVRITELLRDSDMVARLGGDEFVLVLENLKVLEDAEIIALKVIEDLTMPFQLSENDSVQIGASIGISLYPQHGNAPETLMDHADTALYQAKDNGGSCFAYFTEVLKQKLSS